MRIGFIGIGGMAHNYLDSLEKLGENVVAVCDVNVERAAEVAQKYGATFYEDHRAMLSEARLDATFVAIPPGAHENQVADVARAGSAVFVAKPVGLELDRVLRARDAIAQSGVVNQAGYMARYSDITERARELIGDRAPSLGTGRFLCRMGSHPWWGNKAMSGGQMVEQSTHVFDWLRLFLGEVEEAQAYGHSGASSDYTDFEDSTTCNLKFKSGAAGNIVSTCCAVVPGGFAGELVGRDFYLHAQMDTRLIGRIGDTDIGFQGHEPGYFRQVEQFLLAVRESDQSLVRSSYEDAARTLAVTLAANRSLQSGRSEKVAEV